MMASLMLDHLFYLQLAQNPVPRDINVTVYSWERQRSYIGWAVEALSA